MNRFTRRLAWIGAGLTLWASAMGAELKIGYVNAASVLDKAPQAEAVSQKLKQEFALKESKLVAEQKELKEAEDKLLRDSAVMSESERQKVERDLLGHKRDLRRAQDDFREDFNVRRNEEIGKLLAVVQKTIEEIGKEMDFDLIVYEGIAYANPRIDITDKVLKRLEAGGKPSAEAGAKK